MMLLGGLCGDCRHYHQCHLRGSLQRTTTSTRPTKTRRRGHYKDEKIDEASKDMKTEEATPRPTTMPEDEKVVEADAKSWKQAASKTGEASKDLKTCQASPISVPRLTTTPMTPRFPTTPKDLKTDEATPRATRTLEDETVVKTDAESWKQATGTIALPAVTVPLQKRMPRPRSYMKTGDVSNYVKTDADSAKSAGEETGEASKELKTYEASTKLTPRLTTTAMTPRFPTTPMTPRFPTTPRFPPTTTPEDETVVKTDAASTKSEHEKTGEASKDVKTCEASPKSAPRLTTTPMTQRFPTMPKDLKTEEATPRPTMTPEDETVVKTDAESWKQAKDLNTDEPSDDVKSDEALDAEADEEVVKTDEASSSSSWPPKWAFPWPL
jgi:hypothetical protein